MSDIFKNIQEIISAHNEFNNCIDFIKVPCKPLLNLPGLSFLSTKAFDELKHSNRSDELLPEDEIELHLFYAKHLYKAGLCKIEFPRYYKSARSLFTESTATTVGSLAPFYFELGYELCELIPENEWPVENLLSMLKEAECNRRNFLIKRSSTVDDSFLVGITHEEKKRKCQIFTFSVLNVLTTVNINLLCLSLNSQNLSDFYELDK
uniref:GINS complex protein, putative n=1 Tax=Theileria annulata TaxID=5874 RepID=A0A3B0MRV6_THEAN